MSLLPSASAAPRWVIVQSSIDHFPRLRPALQLFDCVHDRPPDRSPLDIACLKQLIRSLSRPDRGILAALVDQQLGGEVEDQCRRPRTASTWAAIAVASVGK